MNKIRIGMLTPSSNTVLEPVSQAMLAEIDNLSLHFSRFRVTEIALSATALGQFDAEPMLAAADLLADAKVDGIAWNGTSAAWLGLDHDRRLCAAIYNRTGIPATTCVLTLADIIERRDWRRIGLVTPYTDDVQARIVACLRGEGFDTIAESHLGIRDNFSFGLVDRATLGRMVAAVAAAGPDVIVILCTNLAGATDVPAWESQHAIPVLDSVAVTLFGALRAQSFDMNGLSGHGRLFSGV